MLSIRLGAGSEPNNRNLYSGERHPRLQRWCVRAYELKVHPRVSSVSHSYTSHPDLGIHMAPSGSFIPTLRYISNVQYGCRVKQNAYKADAPNHPLYSLGLGKKLLLACNGILVPP